MVSIYDRLTISMKIGIRRKESDQFEHGIVLSKELLEVKVQFSASKEIFSIPRRCLPKQVFISPLSEIDVFEAI